MRSAMKLGRPAPSAARSAPSTAAPAGRRRAIPRAGTHAEQSRSLAPGAQPDFAAQEAALAPPAERPPEAGGETAPRESEGSSIDQRVKATQDAGLASLQDLGKLDIKDLGSTVTSILGRMVDSSVEREGQTAGLELNVKVPVFPPIDFVLKADSKFSMDGDKKVVASELQGGVEAGRKALSAGLRVGGYATGSGANGKAAWDKVMLAVHEAVKALDDDFRSQGGAGAFDAFLDTAGLSIPGQSYLGQAARHAPKRPNFAKMPSLSSILLSGADTKRIMREWGEGEQLESGLITGANAKVGDDKVKSLAGDVERRKGTVRTMKGGALEEESTRSTKIELAVTLKEDLKLTGTYLRSRVGGEETAGVSVGLERDTSIRSFQSLLGAESHLLVQAVRAIARQIHNGKSPMDRGVAEAIERVSAQLELVAGDDLLASLEQLEASPGAGRSPRRQVSPPTPAPWAAHLGLGGASVSEVSADEGPGADPDVAGEAAAVVGEASDLALDDGEPEHEVGAPTAHAPVQLRESEPGAADVEEAEPEAAQVDEQEAAQEADAASEADAAKEADAADEAQEADAVDEQALATSAEAAQGEAEEAEEEQRDHGAAVERPVQMLKKHIKKGKKKVKKGKKSAKKKAKKKTKKVKKGGKKLRKETKKKARKAGKKTRGGRRFANKAKKRGARHARRVKRSGGKLERKTRRERQRVNRARRRAERRARPVSSRLRRAANQGQQAMNGVTSPVTDHLPTPALPQVPGVDFLPESPLGDLADLTGLPALLGPMPNPATPPRRDPVAFAKSRLTLSVQVAGHVDKSGAGEITTSLERSGDVKNDEENEHLQATLSVGESLYSKSAAFKVSA